MGVFTRRFADKENQQKLEYGQRGYLACPDGSFIEEPHYGGYGMFQSHDIYEDVVDWNRAYLDEIFTRIEDEAKATGKRHFGQGLGGLARAYQAGDMARVKELCEEITKRNDLPYSYERDWKRDIGITIACDDEDNRRLPFPIKVVSSPDGVSYDKLPASKDDQ